MKNLISVLNMRKMANNYTLLRYSNWITYVIAVTALGSFVTAITYIPIIYISCLFIILESLFTCCCPHLFIYIKSSTEEGTSTSSMNSPIKKTAHSENFCREIFPSENIMTKIFTRFGIEINTNENKVSYYGIHLGSMYALVCRNLGI